MRWSCLSVARGRSLLDTVVSGLLMRQIKKGMTNRTSSAIDPETIYRSSDFRHNGKAASLSEDFRKLCLCEDIPEAHNYSRYPTMGDSLRRLVLIPSKWLASN